MAVDAMLDYGPIPDVSERTPGERGHIMRKAREIAYALSVIERDHRSYRLTHPSLRAFIEAARGCGDYGALQLAIEMWERLPAEHRDAVKARVEELWTPAEIAARETDRALRWQIEHPWTSDHRPEPATAKALRSWERREARRVAVAKAYRAEYRRRMNPHLSLVWVNEHPSAPLRSARFAETLARSRNQMSDILDRLNEGR